MARKETLRVSSSDPANEPGREDFPLADVDHYFNNFVLVALTFKLEDDANPQVITDNLRVGLQTTLSQYRCLRGSLQIDDSERLFIQKQAHSIVPFTINWLDGPEDDFPSYETLEKRDFPTSEMDAEILFPPCATQVKPVAPPGQGSEDDNLVLLVQVNFIRGGLILAAAVQHSCSDLSGIDGFLSHWADYTRCILAGKQPTPVDPIVFDRSPLTSRAKKASTFAHSIVAKSCLMELKDIPSIPEDLKISSLSQIMFHFPSAGLARLKEDAKLPGQAAVSSHDALCAIVWRCITRARLPLFHPDMSTITRFGFAINFRKFMEPPLPTRYFGNALSIPAVDMEIGELVSDGSLPRIASAIRKSIQEQSSAAAIKATAEWNSSVDRKTSIYLDRFTGFDIAATSWSQMRSYQDQDFGFGLPKAVRWPKSVMPGYVFLYPRRPKHDPSEGVELCVNLDSSCMERLMADEELAQYAHPRGV